MRAVKNQCITLTGKRSNKSVFVAASEVFSFPDQEHKHEVEGVLKQKQ